MKTKLLFTRVMGIMPYLRGETINLVVTENKVIIDVGLCDRTSLQKAATDFFHKSYTNFKKS